MRREWFGSRLYSGVQDGFGLLVQPGTSACTQKNRKKTPIVPIGSTQHTTHTHFARCTRSVALLSNHPRDVSWTFPCARCRKTGPFLKKTAENCTEGLRLWHRKPFERQSKAGFALGFVLSQTGLHKGIKNMAVRQNVISMSDSTCRIPLNVLSQTFYRN